MILLVDASATCRELLSKVLESQGIGVTCAATSSDASRALAAAVPELVILDPATDAQGTRFLQSLRQSTRWKGLPVIVLTDLGDKTSIVRAAQLGVRDYILKSRFSLAELLTRMQKYVRAGARPLADASQATRMPTAAESAANPTSDTVQPPSIRLPPASPPPKAPEAPAIPIEVLTRDQTLERIEASTQTKTLPGVVAEVIALVNSPRGAISDVAQAVKRDPVLSARILQLANSAAFTSQRPRVASIDEAVRNIGVAGVRNMVLAVGIFESFAPNGTDLSDMLRLWQHLFAVASIMERLVTPSDAAPPGAAHLVGLCHDLADLALRQTFPSEYAAAKELAKRTGRTIPQIGADVFGIPFHELVTLMLSKLGLPPLITVPIEEFFERGLLRGQQVGLGSVLARALRIANVYAHGLMLAPSPDAPVTPISKSEYRNGFGDAEIVRLDDQTLWSEAVMVVNVLSGAPSALAGKIAQPLIPPSGAKIWYSRHASYCDFDPLAAALHFGGDVELHDGLPKSPDELDGFDILVTAASRQENPLPAQQDIGTILKVTAARPLPVLYLSGAEPAALTGLTPDSCHKLPVPLSAIVNLFAKYRAQTSDGNAVGKVNATAR